jgi:murein DD-endopeptidase MepM/ murein hydrolase activator NlpD
MTARVRLLTLLAAAVVLAMAFPGVAPAGAATDPVGQWPLQPAPEVVRGFDPPESTWGPGHRGVDLAGQPGQPVRAALPGRIAFTGTIAGRPVVTVAHGGTRTTYEPVATTLTRGTPVVAGAVIGSLGVTGSHCFPRACLHWGWIRGETYLDPLRLVGGGPVRLLPLAGLPSDLWAAATLAVPRTSPYAGWAPPAGSVRLWP